MPAPERLSLRGGHPRLSKGRSAAVQADRRHNHRRRTRPRHIRRIRSSAAVVDPTVGLHRPSPGRPSLGRRVLRRSNPDRHGPSRGPVPIPFLIRRATVRHSPRQCRSRGRRTRASRRWPLLPRWSSSCSCKALRFLSVDQSSEPPHQAQSRSRRTVAVGVIFSRPKSFCYRLLQTNLYSPPMHRLCRACASTAHAKHPPRHQHDQRASHSDDTARAGDRARRRSNLGSARLRRF
jgi:hypothetical protein